MSIYFDTAYVAKCYLNEADSAKVRTVLKQAGGGHSSSLSVAELAATLLRHVREGSLTRKQSTKLQSDFAQDIADGVWSIVPITDAFIHRAATRISTISPEVYVRAGDALHLQAATEAGFEEVWTSDRHMLAAAPAFGLRGRTV